MNFIKTVSLMLTLAFSAITLADTKELIYTGKAAVVAPTDKSVRSDETLNLGREQISYLLQMEARVQTVNEALNLKTSGLQYVNNIFDFEYLTSCPFGSPSDAYKKAVGDFIARYAINYVTSRYDIPALNILESRVPTVTQAIAVKQAGMRIRLQIQDFVQLIPPSIANPSEAYTKAISNFIGQNIVYVVDYYSPIYLILSAERYTSLVGDAMAVKRAGLVAVRTQRDLFELASYTVANPSESYRQAVSAFLTENMPRYPLALE